MADTLGPARLTIRVVGVVEHGDHRGRTIGFPTANLYTEDEAALPADGVYAGFVRECSPAEHVLGASAISIGTNPTFGAHRRRLEAHILDFDADIYGRSIEVELLFWMRGMVTFAGVDELVARIHADVVEAGALTQGITPFIDD